MEGLLVVLGFLALFMLGFPVMLAIGMMIVIGVVLMNLLADIAYTFVNPQIRIE